MGTQYHAWRFATAKFRKGEVYAIRMNATKPTAVVLAASGLAFAPILWGMVRYPYRVPEAGGTKRRLSGGAAGPWLGGAHAGGGMRQWMCWD